MAGNLSKSMRENYEQHGVAEYYTLVSKSYRNPHFTGVRSCLWTWMNEWWSHLDEDGQNTLRNMRVLDMAAGSGEASIAIKEWWEAGKLDHTRNSKPENTQGEPSGLSSASVPRVSRTRIQCTARLDANSRLVLDATDPFTCDAYHERTSLACRPLSFRDIADGSLARSEENLDDDTIHGAGPMYEMVICSFALHLIETKSELWALLNELSGKARWLIILAPHKKPEIKEGWGWTLWNMKSWRGAESGEVLRHQTGDAEELEIVRERVRCRVYRSNSF